MLQERETKNVDVCTFGMKGDHSPPTTENASAKGWLSAIANIPIERLTRMSVFEAHCAMKFARWLIELTRRLMHQSCVCISYVCQKYRGLTPPPNCLNLSMLSMEHTVVQAIELFHPSKPSGDSSVDARYIPTLIISM